MSERQLRALEEKIEYYNNINNPIDFCDNFVLEDNIQNNVFNIDFNQPELLWIFKDSETGRETPPLTRDLLEAFQIRIKNDSHIILFIFGPTNSGKSELGEALTLFYIDQFKQILNKDVTYHLAFDDTDVKKAFPKLQVGDMILRDESGQATQKGSRNLEVQVTNVLRVFRAHQNSCIFINPYIIKSPMIDYYLYAQGKNYQTREIRAILYYQYINYLTLQLDIIPIGRIHLPLHEDDEFRRIYKEKKHANIQKLKYLSGLIADVPNIKEIQEDARILVGLCREYGKYTKKAMRLLLLQYNGQFDPATEGDKLIGGDDNYNELLFEQTKIYLESPDQMRIDFNEATVEEIQEEDLFLTRLQDYMFPYTDDEVLEIAKKQARFQDVERDFEIYHKTTLRKRPLLYKDVAEMYPRLSDESAVGHVVTKVRGLLNQVKGALHEKAYTSHLKEIYEENPNNKVIHEGGSAEPDVYVFLEETNELHIFSLKNLDLGHSSSYLPMKELRPELDFAHHNRLNYSKVRVFVSLVNNNTNGFYFSEIEDFSRVDPLKII